MTNDLFPKHAESANRELSSAELDAVAGGFDPSPGYLIKRVVKNFVSVFTHPPISSGVVSIIRGIGSIFHW